MGYETKLLIGKVYDKHNFSCIAEIDLCKCGYKGAFPNLIKQATHKDNPLGLMRIEWSETINPNPNALKEITKKNLANEDDIEEINEIIQSWESTFKKDVYDSIIRAVPIKDVYAAMVESQTEIIKKDGYGYRRYSIALVMLNEFIANFNNDELYCALYGY